MVLEGLTPSGHELHVLVVDRGRDAHAFRQAKFKVT
jgi:hypothetical protein